MPEVKGCKCGHHKKAHVHKHTKAAYFCLACETCTGYEEKEDANANE